MFNLIARGIDGIQVRTRLKTAPTIAGNVGSPLDEEIVGSNPSSPRRTAEVDQPLHLGRSSFPSRPAQLYFDPPGMTWL